MYYIGIDIAKKAHEVCFLNQDGEVLDGNSFKIPNTLSGVEKLQKMLNKYALTPENSQVGMEATGHYWLVLYSWLHEKGFTIKLLLVTVLNYILIIPSSNSNYNLLFTSLNFFLHPCYKYDFNLCLKDYELIKSIPKHQNICPEILDFINPKAS
jgi:hypothetical protein